jgi:hypothetical protein
MEDFALPVAASGQRDNGIIASVNVEDFPPTPLNTGETATGLIGKPVLFTRDAYPPGQMLPILFIWQTTTDVVDKALLELNLFDAAGKPVAQQQQPLHFLNSVIHQPIAETYCFSLPATLAEGDYLFALNLNSASVSGLLDDDNKFVPEISMPIRLVGTDSPLVKNGASEKTVTALPAVSGAGICQLIRADFPRRYEPSTPLHLLDTPFTEEIKLVGYDLAIVPQTSSVLATVILHWNVQANVTRNYLVSVQLLDSAGQAVITHTAVPVHQTRLTSTWLKGEWILDEHLIDVPTLPPGEYQLSLSLVDEQTGEAVNNSLGLPDLVLENLKIP